VASVPLLEWEQRWPDEQCRRLLIDLLGWQDDNAIVDKYENGHKVGDGRK
jgi:hypothetical protein